MSFVYGGHSLALGVLDEVLALARPDLDEPILNCLANIRLRDATAVADFFARCHRSDLARRVAGRTATIRVSDVPTWIDGFFVYWLSHTDWFRERVVTAFRRAQSARNQVVFLRRIMLWVLNLCCNFENVLGRRSREELGGEVSGSQIEQLVDEPILLANIIVANPACLPLPYHVHSLVSRNRSPSCSELAKALLGHHSSFDRSMILLQDVVQILDRCRQRRCRVPSDFTAAIAKP